MNYSQSDQRAVNVLSLVFLGIGVFFIIASSLHAAHLGAVESGMTNGLWYGFFLQRSIIGLAFILCGVCLHLLLKREEKEWIDSIIAEKSLDSTKGAAKQA